MGDERHGEHGEAVARGPTLRKQLERALDGAVYPLSRRELLLIARETEVARELLTRLSALPDATFRGPDEIYRRVAASPSA